MTYHYDHDLSPEFWIGRPISTAGLIGVGIHTSESGAGASALDVTRYQISVQGNPALAGSYNAIVDDNMTVRQNTDDWQTWSTGNKGNDVLLHLCFTGQAGWTRAQWLSHGAMLDRGADVVAYWLRKYGWPNRKVTVSGLPGIVGHADTRAWGGTDHWDPGPNFPWDDFTARIQRRLDGGGTPTEEDTMNAEQAKMLERVHRELTQRYPSRSRYRVNDQPVDTLAGMVLNADARAHENMVERAALMGDEDSETIVRAAAERGDHVAAAVIAEIERKRK